MPNSMSTSPGWSISCGPSSGLSLVLMDTRMPTGTLPSEPSATPSTSSLEWKNAGGVGSRGDGARPEWGEPLPGERLLPNDDAHNVMHSPRGWSRAEPYTYIGLIVCPGGIMKYRVAIYDLDYAIDAKSAEGAIRAAIALYAKTETAQTSRHCSPDRLTRGPTVAEGRQWEAVLEKSRGRSAREADGSLGSLQVHSGRRFDPGLPHSPRPLPN